MTDDHCTCTVEVSPEEVDAGAEITLTVQATHPRKDGLRRAVVSIRDGDDAEIARADLTADGDGRATDDIVLRAPHTAGEHVYRAVILAADANGALHELAATDARFAVTPHAAELNVWDVPSTVVAGERFAFIIGLRCSAGCTLAGHTLNVVGHDGAPAASATLGEQAWPGTDALYFAEVDAQAPATAGSHQWEVTTTAWNSDLPHAAGSFPLVVKVVNPPDCEVTVEVFDRETQTPLNGARVVMHPYRTETGEHGSAKLKVTKGRYDILVSRGKYLPASTTVEVTADMTTRAELDAEPPLDLVDEA